MPFVWHLTPTQHTSIFSSRRTAVRWRMLIPTVSPILNTMRDSTASPKFCVPRAYRRAAATGRWKWMDTGRELESPTAELGGKGRIWAAWLGGTISPGASCTATASSLLFTINKRSSSSQGGSNGLGSILTTLRGHWTSLVSVTQWVSYTDSKLFLQSLCILHFLYSWEHPSVSASWVSKSYFRVNAC